MLQTIECADGFQREDTTYTGLGTHGGNNLTLAKKENEIRSRNIELKLSMINGFTDQRMCLRSCFKSKNVNELRKKLVEERKEKKGES